MFKIVPSEYTVFGGLDTDKKKIHVMMFNHKESDEIEFKTFAYDSGTLIRYLQRRYPGERIALAYEAGPMGYGLHDDLTAAGYTCLVVPAQMTPSGERVKTNRRDARKLGTKLRGGELHGIRVPSKLYRELRHLVRVRDEEVSKVVQAKQRIKSVLLLEQIKFPDAKERWTVLAIEELKKLQCSPAVRYRLDNELFWLETGVHQVRKACRQSVQFCKDNAELSKSLECLTSVTGIGAVVGAHLLARIGDYRLLKNSDEIAGFLGLTPAEWSTGERATRGGITRMGDRRLRKKLIQAAWVAIRKDDDLKKFFWRIVNSNPSHLGPQKAIVAVARKLALRAYAVLRDQKNYEKR